MLVPILGYRQVTCCKNKHEQPTPIQRELPLRLSPYSEYWRYSRLGEQEPEALYQKVCADASFLRPYALSLTSFSSFFFFSYTLVPSVGTLSFAKIVIFCANGKDAVDFPRFFCRAFLVAPKSKSPTGPLPRPVAINWMVVKRDMCAVHSCAIVRNVLREVHRPLALVPLSHIRTMMMVPTRLADSSYALLPISILWRSLWPESYYRAHETPSRICLFSSLSR